MPNRTLRTLGRLAAVAAASLAVQLVPLAAHADVSIPIDGITVATQGASPCQLSSQYMYDAALTATVAAKPGGETDFVWHAAAHAGVSSTDSCVTGIMVKTQLTDTTSVPGCPPVVQSPVGTTTNTDPSRYQFTGKVDYEVENDLDFDVAYFGAPSLVSSADGSLTDNVDAYPGSTPDVRPLALPCERAHSSVIENDTAYYANSQHQYIPYCAQQVTFDFVSTPAGPQQVGSPIVDSITC